MLGGAGAAVSYVYVPVLSALVFCAASVARTRKVYTPSPGLVRSYARVPEHAPQSSPATTVPLRSRRQVTPAPASAVNDHETAATLPAAGGAEVMAGAAGATESRVYVPVAAGPALPARSV